MMRAGEREMEPFAGRYSYVEFDMTTGEWPAAIPAALDAVVTSMCVHHLPDERKQGLFAEIYDHLAPGGWYLNYDPVRAEDPLVEAAWQRVNDHDDPEAAAQAGHRTPRSRPAGTTTSATSSRSPGSWTTCGRPGSRASTSTGSSSRTSSTAGAARPDGQAPPGRLDEQPRSTPCSGDANGVPGALTSNRPLSGR